MRVRVFAAPCSRRCGAPVASGGGVLCYALVRVCCCFPLRLCCALFASLRRF
nr:MAG TPA: hypothetical protein [Caudoviricetes sp.]